MGQIDKVKIQDCPVAFGTVGSYEDANDVDELRLAISLLLEVEVPK